MLLTAGGFGMLTAMAFCQLGSFSHTNPMTGVLAFSLSQYKVLYEVR